MTVGLFNVSHFPLYPLLEAAPSASDYSLRLTADALRARGGEVPTYPDMLARELAAGDSAALRHHEELRQGFAELKGLLEKFDPDVVIVVGDDQGEIFSQETSIPQVLIVGAPELEGSTMYPGPAARSLNRPIRIQGEQSMAMAIVNGLRLQGRDVTWTTDSTIGHAVTNTVAYLYPEAEGGDGFSWPWATIPILVNTYGDLMTASGGNFQHRLNTEEQPAGYPYLDPVGFTPKSAIEFGRALREVLDEIGGDRRIALVASGSWSHGFLTDMTLGLYPDVEGDRQRFDQLRRGVHGNEWAKLTLEDVHQSGLQEFLHTVMVFAGAYPERVPTDMLSLVETMRFNSPKCFAVSLPEA